MSEPASFLREHPFLAGMSEEHLARLEGCCRAAVTSFRAGQPIFHAGDQAEACYLIQHGDVAIQVHTPGSGARTIQTLHGGDVLGWSWLFPPFSWSFDAVAITSVRAIMLDGARLMEQKEEDHEFGYELMRRFAGVVVERLQATRLQLLDLYAAGS